MLGWLNVVTEWHHDQSLSILFHAQAVSPDSNIAATVQASERRPAASLPFVLFEKQGQLRGSSAAHPL